MGEASLLRRQHVDEVLIVDPIKRSVDWLGVSDGQYRPIQKSGLLDLSPAELAQLIDWPQVN